jgi:hypothetical protein
MLIRLGVWVSTLSACLVGPLSAHDIITTKLTYTRDVSRILVRHCSSCHNEGTAIPLTSYEEVRPWAVGIKEQVLSRAMPPWGAVKGFGDLKPDESLTQEDLIIIAAWVIGGAPKGDLALLPKNSAPARHTETRALGDAVEGTTRLVLSAPLRAVGIRPDPDSRVESARITANLPDGRVQPLVWLYRFDPKWKRIFLFRQPLDLPPGTVIESSAPVRFALEVSHLP